MLSVHMLVNSGKHYLVISVAIYTCLTTFDHVLTRLMLAPRNSVLVNRNMLCLLWTGELPIGSICCVLCNPVFPHWESGECLV